MAARATGAPSSKYVVYATACVYRELYGKITDRKKMCGELVSCAEFRAILTPFSEVIRKPLLLLLNGVRMALNSAQETSSPHI